MNNKGIAGFFAAGKPGTISVFCIVFILYLRLVFIGLMGLMPQDAYYHLYSEHLALSYYDHPPLIAYILKLFVTVFGQKAFAIKLADSVVTGLALYSFYHLAACFLSKHKAQNAFILFFSTLLVTILSLITTPDTPLILFWTLSLLAIYKALFNEKKVWWIWSGILMGLAFDSKYTAIFLPLGLTLFLVLSNRYRKTLISPWFWMAVIFFLATISPVIIWNINHDFVSFRFQSSGRVNGISGIHLHINYFLGTIGTQAAILLPVLFVSLFIFLYKYFRKYKLRIQRMPAQKLFLLCFFVPVFLGFFCISFLYWVKLNWMMPAYITGIIWVSVYFNKKWIRYQLLFSMILHLGLAIEVIFYPIPVKSDDTWYGWKELASQVKSLQIQYPDAFVFSADENKTSAILDFYLVSRIYGENIIGRPALQFDYIGTNLDDLKGQDALFINSDPGFKDELKENDIPAELPGYFDSITELDPILIRKNGKPVRKFTVYLCKNYKPPNKRSD